MPVSILYPRYDHPAIEERYASWQSQLLLRRGGNEMQFYDFDERACDAVADVETDHVLVVTDPLLLAGPDLADRLLRVLEGSQAFAAVPATNEAAIPSQQFTPRPYMTLRELELEIAAARGRNEQPQVANWTSGDPGAFLTTTSALASVKVPLSEALSGRQVVVSPTDFVHRWASMRGQAREDLLTRISPAAKSILEFGCGEGTLGAALKQRQKCRVVGIEIDRRAVTLARKRIDDVYCGDVNEIVALIHERFDCIVGGDIVEHLSEPWAFLADLRRISSSGGELLLSLPNLANASIVADLLRGRFDYVYMGLTCAGHLRFFTRRTIEDMISIAGWETVSVEPQQLTITPELEELMAKLEAAHVPFSREDLLPTGFYVRARNPE